jgi:long-chain acyl-CoA synthetase
VYPAGVPTTYPYPAVHAARLLDDAAHDFPDEVAVEYRSTG